MSTRNKSGRWFVMLLLLSAGLGWVIYLEYRMAPLVPVVFVSPVSQPVKSMELSAAMPGDFPPLQAFAEIVERPLFSRTRRPPQPATDDSTVTPPGKINLILTGLIISSKDRLALLRLARSKTIIRAGVNQVIEGWTVTAIKSDRVILARGDEVEEIRLIDRPVLPKRKAPRTKRRDPAQVPRIPQTPPTPKERETKVMGRTLDLDK